MASKLTMLQWPPYHVHKGTVYTNFLKTVFDHNYQRRDLMDKEIIDARWIHMVDRDIREKHVREKLIGLIKKKDGRKVWRDKYTPEKLIIRSGPRIDGTRAVVIDDRSINLPALSRYDIGHISYVQFASTTLPRVNPHRRLDRKTTDQAWRSHVDYFKNWNMKGPKRQASDFLAQSRSDTADKYWAEREAEQEASEQQEVDGP